MKSLLICSCFALDVNSNKKVVKHTGIVVNRRLHHPVCRRMRLELVFCNAHDIF